MGSNKATHLRPRRGESTISVPASPVNEGAAHPPQKSTVKNNKNQKRKRKSRSESVWCISGGLPGYEPSPALINQCQCDDGNPQPAVEHIIKKGIAGIVIIVAVAPKSRFL